MDEIKFLEQCKDLVEYAKTKESQLSKKEIGDYFEELKLSTKQMQSVYEYLIQNNIDISGVEKSERMSSEDSAYLKIYRKEIRSLNEYDSDELHELHKRLSEGDDEVTGILIESYLRKVVNIAGKYKNRGVLLEDLIQEGNLILIMTVQEMCGNCDPEKAKKRIERAIRARMIELCDLAGDQTGRENTILAKTNLIHEATRVLAEDLGRLGNIHELAEYTRMTEEEILDIVELALDKIEIGTCEHEHYK